jgi:outer membrane receptor for ferrienterochelin and colicin
MAVEFSVAVIAMGLAQATATPAPTTAPPANGVAAVVVTAERPPVVEQIDRTVHDVKGDPLAQTASALELLGKLPSVTVTPTGKVSLLGSSVKVLIDGRPPLNDQAVKTMLGSEIDRIEVMTNPSARYGADGAGGIIDIRTRKRFKPGLTGAITTNADTDGNGLFRVAPTWTFGKWTVGGSLGVNRNAGRSETHEVRQILAPAQYASTLIQDTLSKTSNHGTAAKFRASYKPDDRRTLTLTAGTYRMPSEAINAIDSVSSVPAVGAYRRFSTAPGDYRNANVNLSYERTGPREGETLAVEATYYSSLWSQSEAVDETYANPASPSGRLRTGWRYDTDDTSAKLDYQRPFAGKRLLSLGGSWERSEQVVDKFSATLAQGVRVTPEYAYQLDGATDTGAAYATFQFTLGPWTLLPGARLETWRADLRAGGEAVARRDTSVTESLHVSRDLPGGVKLKLSYAERLGRPSLDDLNPYLEYSDADQAFSGNPDLKPSVTHAFEIHADKTIAKQAVGVTLYDRETRRTWDNFTRVTAGGVSVSSQINTGDSANRGAELSLRGPLGARWRYSATGNLFQSERQVQEDGRSVTDSRVRYGGNLQLDYKAVAGKAGRAPEQVQLALRYDSPERSLQGSSSTVAKVDLTWRHALTRRVAGELTVTDVFDSFRYVTHLESPQLIHDLDYRGTGRRFKLSLTYRLGKLN